MLLAANHVIRLESFVDRDDELKIIQAKLDAIKTGSHLFDFIIRISGVPGIGKSTRNCRAAEYKYDFDKV